MLLSVFRLSAFWQSNTYSDNDAAVRFCLFAFRQSNTYFDNAFSPPRVTRTHSMNHPNTYFDFSVNQIPTFRFHFRIRCKSAVSPLFLSPSTVDAQAVLPLYLLSSLAAAVTKSENCSLLYTATGRPASSLLSVSYTHLTLPTTSRV